MTILQVKLPFPPSVNHYYRTIRMGACNRTLISKEGRLYTQQVAVIVKPMLTRGPFPILGPIKIDIDLIMPDARRRDIDNAAKCVLDSLTKSGVWADDSQIDVLTIRRGSIDPKNGYAMILINDDWKSHVF